MEHGQTQRGVTNEGTPPGVWLCELCCNHAVIASDPKKQACEEGCVAELIPDRGGKQRDDYNNGSSELPHPVTVPANLLSDRFNEVVAPVPSGNCRGQFY